MRTGGDTSQWPYSLTTQTPLPCVLAAVEQGGAGGVELADEPGHVAARGAEALGVVVEVGQVDERQVGPLAIAGPRRPRGRSTRCTAARRPAPRRCGTGTGRGRVSSRSVRPSGVPVMPNALLPSAP